MKRRYSKLPGRNNLERIDSTVPGRGLRLAVWAVLAVAISAVPAPGRAAEGCGGPSAAAAIKVDERLSATFVGGLAAGGEGRLAARWSGPGEARLSVWVDFDGDGAWSDRWETIVWGATLRQGIEVFEFEVPPGAEIGAGTRARFRVESATGVRELTRRLFAGGSGPEGCGFAPEFHLSGFNHWVEALAVYDDGSGPALYAAGSFTTAGEAGASHIAKWDGSGWSALTGPEGSGTDDTVRALAVYDDGSGPALYVGGLFIRAGGVVANRIAKWDGSQWSALTGAGDTGVRGEVHALAAYDDGGGPALYVGGMFTIAGGVVAYRMAKWDGSEWSALSGPTGTGMNGTVAALTVYDDGGGPALYAGGWFTRAGGAVANHVARWDGSQWSGLSGPAGNGTSGGVYALAVYDDGSGPALYAGGSFGSASGVPAPNIARWDGSQWSALSGPAGTGTDDLVEALAVYDDGSGPALYAGGRFGTAGGVAVDHIAKWDGAQWSALIGLAGTGTDDWVRVLAVYDDGGGAVLYAAGLFGAAGGIEVRRIGRWDGSEWSALSGPPGMGLQGQVYALAVYDDGSGPALYAGGWFTAAGGVAVHNIGKWDGSGWSALTGPGGGTGTDRRILALAVYDDGGGPALYAGGEFTTAGGVAVNRIARWDGAVWSALGGPASTSDRVEALAVYDDGGGAALYVGGWFTAAGSLAVHNIGKWDGSGWSALSGPEGMGTNGTVRALAVYDDGGGAALYAGGSFSTAGGILVNDIAKWDGAQWSALGGSGGTGPGGVLALAVYDDDSGAALYAGGEFTTIRGVTAHHIAKWDGSQWSALSGPAGTGTDNRVLALAVYDDGDGAALYAGGSFTTAGGVDAHFIARWNGSYWAPLLAAAGQGMGSRTYLRVGVLAVHDDGGGEALFVGGFFDRAGGIASSSIARFSFPCDRLFSDGFESGDTSAWSRTQ